MSAGGFGGIASRFSIKSNRLLKGEIVHEE